MTTTRTPPPESLGPGSDSTSGQVSYGVAGPRAVFPEDTRPLREPVANPRCPRCEAIPDSVAASITQALRSAARDGKPPL